MPSPYRRSLYTEVSADMLEEIAYDRPGSVMEFPPDEPYAYLSTTDGMRFCAPASPPVRTPALDAAYQRLDAALAAEDGPLVSAADELVAGVLGAMAIYLLILCARGWWLIRREDRIEAEREKLQRETLTYALRQPVQR